MADGPRVDCIAQSHGGKVRDRREDDGLDVRWADDRVWSHWYVILGRPSQKDGATFGGIPGTVDDVDVIHLWRWCMAALKRLCHVHEGAANEEDEVEVRFRSGTKWNLFE